MSSTFRPEDLDAPCPHDGKPVGEHTMREWVEHLDADPHTDLAFEEDPDGPVWLNLPDDARLPLADTIVARATLFEGELSGGVRLAMPVLVIDFQVAQADQPPRTFYSVGIIATSAVMRKHGKLLRDAAYGAANAGESSR